MIWGPVFPNVEGEGIPSKIKLFDASWWPKNNLYHDDGKNTAISTIYTNPCRVELGVRRIDDTGCEWDRRL